MLDDVLLVDRDREPPGNDIVYFLVVCQLELGIRVTENPHHIRERYDSVKSVLDEHIFICTIKILVRTYLKVKRS